MTVLVTGGCGQIGSHLVDYFVEKKTKVVVIDNLVTGRKIHLPENKLISLYTIDIYDLEAVTTIFNKYCPEIVIHAAASYLNCNDWYTDTTVNSVGGINLIKCAMNYEVKKFIYLQTALCYNFENTSKPIDLSTPLDPRNGSYAITKTVTENYLQISSLDFISFRLTNIIGPRNLSGPLPIFYENLKNNNISFIADATRDFVHVKDLVEVIKQACFSKHSGIYNFSSGRQTSIKDLYYLVAKHMLLDKIPKPIYRVLGSDHAKKIWLDNSKLIKDFDSIVFTSLDQTVHDCVEYYNEFGTSGLRTHLKI